MAKKIYVYFAWKDNHVTMPIEDNQTVRGALRWILPNGVNIDSIENAIDETGVNVIDRQGANLHDGMKITVSRNKVYQGGNGDRSQVPK
jgi:hypothetical protein